jgi:hypothetical protein
MGPDDVTLRFFNKIRDFTDAPYSRPVIFRFGFTERHFKFKFKKQNHAICTHTKGKTFMPFVMPAHLAPVVQVVHIGHYPVSVSVIPMPGYVGQLPERLAAQYIIHRSPIAALAFVRHSNPLFIVVLCLFNPLAVVCGNMIFPIKSDTYVPFLDKIAP